MDLMAKNDMNTETEELLTYKVNDKLSKIKGRIFLSASIFVITLLFLAYTQIVVIQGGNIEKTLFYIGMVSVALCSLFYCFYNVSKERTFDCNKEKKKILTEYRDSGFYSEREFDLIFSELK